MRNVFLSLVIALLMIAGCTSDEPSETSMPTQPPLVGHVEITSPKTGAIIYAETLYIGGSIQGVDRFQLQVQTLDGDMLYDSGVMGVAGHWNIEIPHAYVGEPIEAIVRAKSSDDRVTLPYGEMSILISSLDNRPEGIFGAILAPADGSPAGGDAIQVNGTASGIPDNRLTVTLRDDKGLIDKQVIVQDNPYHVDERTWSADLLTNGYTGTAMIDLAYTDSDSGAETLLDSISIVIGSAAG